MTATNHALSGALIGLAITQPVVALPLAFASHFVLDAVPHFGLDDFGGHLKARSKFIKLLYVDATLLSMVILWLFIAGAPWLAFACLFIAGAPDFAWAYRYVFKENWGRKPPMKMNRFNRFHVRIQPTAKLKGAFVEVPLAIIFVVAIARLL